MPEQEQEPDLEDRLRQLAEQARQAGTGKKNVDLQRQIDELRAKLHNTYIELEQSRTASQQPTNKYQKKTQEHGRSSNATEPKYDPHTDAELARLRVDVRQHPNSAPFIAALADALVKVDPKRAVKEYERAISLTPDDGFLHYSFGSALLHDVGDYEGAIREFHAAMTSQKPILGYPSFAVIQFQLGLAYHKKGDFDEAIEAYQEALKSRDINREKCKRDLERAMRREL